MNPQSFRIEVRSFSDTDPAIRTKMSSTDYRIVREKGYAYLRIGETVYSCEDCPESLRLLEACAADSRTSTEDREWLALLKGSEDPLQAAQKLGIPCHGERSVILFRPAQPYQYSDLQDSIPLEGSDRMIPLENGDAVLILSMKRRTRAEVIEFVSAATETMESEAGISCCAGIGRPAASIEKLPSSYREAEAAIKTGKRHRMPGSVFDYERQTLERLADLIPEEEASRFRQEIVTEEAAAVLKGEMLETIRVFLRNDLNLSTTARELFVHRNTLLYRMEKIRRVTGLDLRKFEDAAVFRIIMSLRDAND